ncbi:MAG TPA: 3-oxoacyl-[acyl-carrier-protein] reductase [Candidatus Brocadiia bacterium]|nr:3-oxoacyl-[acyl-carrier-protein] reductase [Candidatus Brocadiia bacterium]
MSGRALEGQTAIVTGASRGIGRCVAIRLAEAGACVVAVARSEDCLQNLESEIRASGGCAEVRTLDVRDTDAFAELAKDVFEKRGRLDILVNNAGIARDGLLARMSEESWDAVIETNLKGCFNGCRAAARWMIRQRSGSIVNISSVAGVAGNAGQANYCASKAGVIGLTKSLARELGGRNIRVNAVAPGFIRTDMTRGVTEEFEKEFCGRIALGRFGEVDDAANVVVFLAGPNAGYITGQVVCVDGGLVI